MTFPPKERVGPPPRRAATAAQSMPFLFAQDLVALGARVRAFADEKLLMDPEPETAPGAVEVSKRIVRDLAAADLLGAAIGPADAPRKGSLARCLVREEIA